MTLNRKVVLIIVAVVYFLVALILNVVDETNAKLVTSFLLGGLAAFAAAFLP